MRRRIIDFRERFWKTYGWVMSPKSVIWFPWQAVGASLYLNLHNGPWQDITLLQQGRNPNQGVSYFNHLQPWYEPDFSSTIPDPLLPFLTHLNPNKDRSVIIDHQSVVVPYQGRWCLWPPTRSHLSSSSILANKCGIELSFYSNFATPCPTALRIDSEEMVSWQKIRRYPFSKNPKTYTHTHTHTLQPIFFFFETQLERERGGEICSC